MKTGRQATPSNNSGRCRKCLSCTLKGIKSNNKILLTMELEKKKFEAQQEQEWSIVTDDYPAAEVEVPKRVTWGGRFEFMLTLIGYTVGMGNIWRFPYLCFRNGGGVFLIPFCLFLLLCGGPLYYMEVVAGQFSGKSAFNVWDICPILRGIGITMCIISSIFIWCYALIFSWILYFLYQSFKPTLGWTTCDNDWNTPTCFDGTFRATSQNESGFINISDVSYNITSSLSNDSRVILRTNYTSPGWEFWQYNVLQKSRGIDETGSLQWHLFAGLFVGWLLVFLCLVKGIKTLGKVVYVTVIAPYILLTVLLIRGITLDGAWDGLRLYLVPDFSRLSTKQIWMEAAVQVFYSLGPAWGSIITMASFNKFNHNALRDTVVVCFSDAFTAFYGGLIVFSVIGFLSKRTGTPIADLPFAGPALAFIVYPEALGQLPLPQVWSVLFFTTLIFIGIDSQFGTFEVISNAVIDMNYNMLHKYRTLVSGGLVLCLFLLGIPLTFSNGLYIFQLADWYMATFNVLIVAILECIVFSWIYGANRYSQDIRMMVGKPPSFFLRLEWTINTPIFLGIILCMNFVGYSPVTGEGGYQFPAYALAVGNAMAFGPLVPIGIAALYVLYQAQGSLQTRIRTSFIPNTGWKPNDAKCAEVYRTNPYKYSRSVLGRIAFDTFGIKQTTGL